MPALWAHARLSRRLSLLERRARGAPPVRRVRGRSRSIRCPAVRSTRRLWRSRSTGSARRRPASAAVPPARSSTTGRPSPSSQTPASGRRPTSAGAVTRTGTGGPGSRGRRERTARRCARLRRPRLARPPASRRDRGACSCRKASACKTPGKHPRLQNWQNFATIDADLLAGWWSVWSSANVGILTGRRSNLVVLDVDPRHGGDRALQELIGAHEPLPDTPVVFTGGGGWHYYFACPPGDEPIKSVTLAEGLELKADGTFVVAPPSKT